VIVINPTNINKTKNHLTCLTEFTEQKKRPPHMMLEIEVLDWDRHKNKSLLFTSSKSSKYTLKCVSNLVGRHETF